MTYVANPTDGTRPLDSDDASGGAAELRALKAYLQGLVTGGSSFLAYGLAGFRNKLINGNFDIWTRGTSLGSAVNNAAFLADRWANDGVGSTTVISQQAHTLGQVLVPLEPRFLHRTVVTSVANAANFAKFRQRIEGVRTFAGQAAIFSFYAKADATKNIAIEFVQNFGTGGAPSAAVTAIGVTTKTLSSTFALYTVSVTLPSISGKTIGTAGDDYLEVNFWFDAGSNFNARTNSLGQQSGTFDISECQFESGGNATPFELLPPGETIQLCQRYATLYSTDGNATGFLAGGSATAGATAGYNFAFPERMRGAPSFTNLQPAGNYILTNGAGASVGAATGFTLVNPSPVGAVLSVTCAGGLTAGQGSNLYSNGAVATGLLFISEL